MASTQVLFIVLVWCIVMTAVMADPNLRILTPDQFVELLSNNARTQPGPQHPDLCMAAPPDAEVGLPCSLLTGRTLYQGQCVRMLKRGPCPAMHWVVKDKKTERSVCQFQLCADHQVLVAGSCERLGEQLSTKHCSTTLQLIINEYGEPECECPDGRIYHKQTQMCYDPYTTGPCPQGQVIQVVDNGTNGGYGMCLPSLCPQSGQVPMTPKCELVDYKSPGDYTCYAVNTIGPCKEGFLSVDLSLSTIQCTQNVPYAIFSSLPSRPCSRGSRRDAMRRCRREFDMNSDIIMNGNGRASVAPTIKPGGHYDNGMVCPDSYFYLAGTCVNIVRGT